MTEGVQCNKCKIFIPKFKPAPKKEKTVSKPRSDDDIFSRYSLGASLFSYTVESTTTVPTTEKKDTIQIDLCADCAKKLDKWLASEK